ncbi:MAG: hypothetical protein KF819_12375 [Labilithrix sp.]|nr:hypothetical protein [Labilithrix sp.]
MTTARDIPMSDLLHAAKTLLGAPVRGASPDARFVEAGDELAVVVDDASQRIGAALARAAEEIDARATVVVLERPEDKPIKVLAPDVHDALVKARTAVVATRCPNAERSMREQLAAVVKACGIRHARLADITEHAFARGLRLDQRVVCEAGRAMEQRLALARAIDVESSAGTRLRIGVTPGGWVERLGEVAPGVAVGFPAGALYTLPDSVEGIFVADASLGEFFGAREGSLRDKPVRFEIRAGKVVSVHAPSSPALEADVRATLGFADGSDRVGLVVIGVNGGIEEPSGDAAVDQNLPGLHLGIGDAGGRMTTAVSCKARTAFAACQATSRVTIDGQIVVEGGKLVDAGIR